MERISLIQYAYQGLYSIDFIEILLELGFNEAEIAIYVCKEYLNKDNEEIQSAYSEYSIEQIQYIYKAIDKEVNPAIDNSFDYRRLGWVDSTRYRNKHI